MKTTPNPPRKPKAQRNTVKARLMWHVRSEGNACGDLTDDEMAAQNLVDEFEEGETAASMGPVFVIDASLDSVEAMIEDVARALAPLAFHEYKAGECLPRGHEMDTVERVNEMQEWRRRSAFSDARKAMRALGLQPPAQPTAKPTAEPCAEPTAKPTDRKGGGRK